MKFVLGRTPEELAKEESQRMTEIAEEVQKREAIRNSKLLALERKKKKNKLIVKISLGVFATIFFLWGTFNTFFKHQLTPRDVQEVINQTVNQFPTAGLEGYIRQNFDTWFNKGTSLKDGDVESLTPELDSLSIDATIPINSNVIRTYFSVDITVKHKDSKDSSGNVVTAGHSEKSRYTFYLPIEYYSNYNDQNQRTVSGYRPVEQLSLYTLNRIDTPEVKENDLLAFSGELESKDVMESAKIKVTKTLEDLFEGRDTSQDFLNYLTFNNYGAKFSSVNDFKMYQQPNKLGYNAKVTYTIITKDGFTYTTSTYLLVAKSDKTWVIKGSL